MIGFAEEKPFLENLDKILKIRPDFLSLAYEGTDNRFKIFKLSK